MLFMMITGIVKYWDLGRSKEQGIIKIVAKDEKEFNEKMDKEFRKHLISQDISFKNGMVFAGLRHVGNFEFIAKKDVDEVL
jgi:hypothetical protein